MSPEQARGGQVDRRSDIWAFGVVLYEMLTGRRLFDEATVSDTLAGVLKSDLRLDALPREAPSSVKRLIERCLTRDLRRRLRDIGEARIAIESTLAHPEADVAGGAPSTSPSEPVWRRVLPWAIAAGAVAAAVLVWAPWRVASPLRPAMRLTSDFGANLRLSSTAGSSLVLSPDSKLLLIVGIPDGSDRPRLFVRRLDELQATLLPGTEGARNAFFSPDGQTIGFFADGKLKRIPVTGGAAVSLCDAPDDRGGSWSDDGWIVFSPRSGESPLFRVSEKGGTPEAVTKLGPGEVTHRWPQVLPGGRAFLYTASTATGNYEDASIVVKSIVNGETTLVHRGGYYARYLPTGHLLYVSRGSLFAARFNLDRLAIESPAFHVVDNITNSPVTGGAQFSASVNGSFVYVPSAGESGKPSIFWLTADGKTEPLRPAPADYDMLRFSPDGERLAIAIRDLQSDLWTYEWRRDLLSRITSHPSLDANPIWSPDGQHLAFRSARDGVDNVYVQRADGTGAPQRLTESKVPHWPKSWHSSGQFIAYEEIGRERDVWVLPIRSDGGSGWRPGKATAFLSSAFNETDPAFSPDGHWLAYASDESGRTEVYVVPFPGPGDRWQVSTSGGSFPKWSSNQRELFYLGEDRKIMVTPLSVQASTLRAEKPHAWSDVAVAGFDLHPDGKRLAVLKSPESPATQRVSGFVFVVNFFDDLTRLTATGK